MNTLKNVQLIKKILLVMASFSFIACSAKHEPAAEVYSNEPVIVANNSNDLSRYDAPRSSEPTVDDSSLANSSGIAAPSEDTGFVEPPVEMMNGVEPPAQSLASDEANIEPTMEATPEPETTSNVGLSEIPADYFTVQVVASSSMKSLNAFAAQYGLATKLTAQVTAGTKVWNVLLVGSYPTLEEAKTALIGIKANVPTSPWIRKISTLQ